MLGESPVQQGTNEVAGGAEVVSRGVWRDPVIWSIAALSLGAYFVISLYRLLTLTPTTFDMGVFTEFMKQLSQLHAPVVDLKAPGFNLEGDHFQVAIGVIAPFFRLFPTPATLLFFQALFTAVSVFPVATVAFQLTGRSTGRLIGFAYAFSWGLQQMIDQDFHELALAVPLLAFSVSALVRRRPAATIAWAMPLVFVKEDQASPWPRSARCWWRPQCSRHCFRLAPWFRLDPRRLTGRGRRTTATPLSGAGCSSLGGGSSGRCSRSP